MMHGAVAGAVIVWLSPYGIEDWQPWVALVALAGATEIDFYFR